MGSDLKLLQDYIGTIEKELVAGNATEHTHRPALKALIEAPASGVTATNEPSRIECGALTNASEQTAKKIMIKTATTLYA